MTATAHPPIRLLPEHLIDQIKAGEVIERPANVLKELLENALDAGARQIDVEIRDNGLTLLRVSDDGCGIPAGELELAFGRHATSKIQAFDDLYRLATFGFRGEALPSIASISRLECVSWTSHGPMGGSLRLEGGMPGHLMQVAKGPREHGTVMTVQDLFFNTPVRLKFMQSVTSEKNWLKRFFYAFALASPTVGFSLAWDDSERLIYPPARDHQERLLQLFGHKAQGRLDIHQANRQWQGYSCHVISVMTHGARADGPLEHVMINGRPVLDKTYGRIVQQVLEKHSLLETPETLIFLTVPHDHLDVNVHPNKTVVKFHQAGDILSLVSATVREALPVTALPQRPAAELPLRAQPGAQEDLERDRAQSYAQHLERFQQLENEEALPLPQAVQLLHASPGPYFLWRLPLETEPLYVDGAALLQHWVKQRSQERCESCPLLVSHPLKDSSLTPAMVDSLTQQGYELDQLEENFWVIREVPLWGKGVPLSQLVSISLRLLGLKSVSPSMVYQEITQAKWNEVWASHTSQEWCDKGVALRLTPALLPRKS